MPNDIGRECMIRVKKLTAALLALAVIAACAAALALTGDADGNGTVGVADAVILCRFIAANDAGAADMLVMDVDADGRLSVADVCHICRAIMDGSAVFPRDAADAIYSRDVE